MPYLIRIPPTHDHLPATLHPLHPFGLEVESIVALSSTSTLDLTLVNDFREWGWQVRHVDLDSTTNPSTNDTASSIRRSSSIAHSDESIDLDSVARAPLQKWYEGYRKRDAKHGLRARVFRVWELEHGRRIRVEERREGERGKDGKGLKRRLVDLL